jgi:signal transduction histidine kinase
MNMGDRFGAFRRIDAGTLAILAVACALFVVASSVDLFELIHDFSRQYEDYEIDEAILLLLIGAPTAALLAWRRAASVSRAAKASRATVIDLRSTNDDLRQSLQFQRQVILQVTHDVRNALQTAALHAGIASRTILASPDTGRAHLERSEAALQRTVDLLDDLIIDAQAIGNTLTATRAPVDLIALAAEVVPAHEAIAALRGSVITIEGPDGPGAAGATPLIVSADRRMVFRALANLVGNAIKYGGGQPVTVTIVDDGTGGARLCVTDHGIGIAAEAISDLFAPFVRGDRPEVQAEQGFGIGLNYVAAAATAHGGRVTVESRLGAGSTFVLHLPG